ncbi:MAG: hypothetical protein FWE98_06645 [Oscillospiraceae bacterium]|nr:hypothetical protein [Oscillospiraceae bacterium]
MREFFKSKKWRIILWATTLVLSAVLLIPLNFVSAWQDKVVELLCFGLAWYALLLSYRAGKGKLRRTLCVFGVIVMCYISLSLPVALLGFTRSPMEYINSPNGENTAVVIRSSFKATSYNVTPLRAKVFIRSGEGVLLSIGVDPPDTSEFIWIDENTLQFEDWDGETQTIRF